MPNLVLERKIEQAIERWFSSGDSKPLLIQGARRTGKTFTVEHVGRRLAGDRFVKLDFQTDLAAIERIFSGASDDVDAIVARIAEYKRVDLTPGDSLIFFDEVQLHEKALNALRFFSDSWWRIIASGSLLGVTTKKRSLPFPSGVRQLTMTPLDFEEFLWAQGERRMADDIRTHVETLEPYMLHEQALGWYRRYLVVGGMPLPVRRWCETRSMEAVAEEQREIDATYTADMTDPQNGISGISAKRIWESLPRQLLRGGKALGLQRVQGALRRGQREQQRLLVVRLQLLRKLQAPGPVAAAVARAQPLGASGGFLLLFVRKQPRGLDAEDRRQIFQRPDRRRGQVVFQLREHIARDAVAHDLRLGQPAVEPGLFELLSERHSTASCVNVIYSAYILSYCASARKRHRING